MRGGAGWAVIAAWVAVAACGSSAPGSSAPGQAGDPCMRRRDCDTGLACALWEDSSEGSCVTRACAETWTGYGCRTQTDTGLAR
jgi:hypothetical protein